MKLLLFVEETATSSEAHFHINICFIQQQQLEQKT